MGRPKIYNSAEDMERDIKKYFAECDKKNKPYTMSGLAYTLNMSRQSLINYSKDEAFFDTIKKAKEKVEVMLEESLYRLGNNSGIIFNLKNNYGWRDTVEVKNDNEMSKLDELLGAIKNDSTKQ